MGITAPTYTALFGHRKKAVVNMDLTDPSNPDFLKLVDFSRLSNALQVNVAGNYEWAQANQCVRSSLMATGPWSPQATSVAAIAAGSDQFNMLETVGTSVHRDTQPITNLTIGQPYEMQLTVRGGITRGFALLIASTTGLGISINLSSGAVSTATGSPLGAYTVTQENDGTGVWYTVGFHFVATASTETYDIFISTDGVYANRSYAGNTADGIAIRHPVFCIYESQRTPAPYNDSGSSGQQYFAPRFVFDPSTHAAKGLLVEDLRTNLLLGALYDGSDLGLLQDISPSNNTYCISFSGSGTITLTGGATATITGIGAYPARVNTTFLASGATVHVAATADVKYAQIELGSDPSTFIPTTATASATRVADVPQINAHFPSFGFSQVGGTFVMEVNTGLRVSPVLLTTSTSGQPAAFDASYHMRTTNGPATALATTNTSVIGTAAKIAMTYTATSRGVCLNGGAVARDNNAPFGPPVTELLLGTSGTVYCNTTIKSLKYYPTPSTDAQLQAFTV